MAARQSIIVASYELQNELSNEKRFQKTVIGALQQVRNGMGDALFTVSLTSAYSHAPRNAMLTAKLSRRTRAKRTGALRVSIFRQHLPFLM